MLSVFGISVDFFVRLSDMTVIPLGACLSFLGALGYLRANWQEALSHQELEQPFKKDKILYVCCVECVQLLIT